MRRVAPATAALAACAVALACTNAKRTADLALDPHPDVLHRVETAAPLVGLTLDDGPDPLGTPALLDVLARHGATATFFLLGERADAHPELVERIVAGGHELGNHGMRDAPGIELGEAAFVRDLRAAERELTAFQPELRWYRPGSAWYDDAMVEAARRHGYTLALGSVYPFDAQIEDTSFASWWLRTGADPGDVIVLHDGPQRGLRAARVLDVVLPDLAAKGMRGVTLGELVDATREAAPPPPSPAPSPAAPARSR